LHLRVYVPRSLRRIVTASGVAVSVIDKGNTVIMKERVYV